MIVAVAFVCFVMAYGILYSFPVFFVAMFEELGWSRGMTAAAFSANMFVYGVSAPLCGALLDRWGPRVVVPVGACVLSIGLAASSQMSSVWQLYLYYGVIAAVGMNLCGTVPNVAVIQQWFVRRRGTALGFASAGIGAGMLVMAPLMQYLVSTIGWRGAYQALAAMTFFTIVPMATLLHRHRPQDMGLQPDGFADGEQAGMTAKVAAERLVVDHVWAAREWTLRRAMATHRFWLLGLGMIMAPLAMQTVLVHQIAFLVDAGYDKMVAAFSFGMVGVVSAVCRIMWGYVSDRIGREHSWVLGVGFTIAGIATLVVAALPGRELLLWAFALLFGVGYAAGAPLFPALVADIFHGRHFGAVYGLLYIGVGIGGGIGPWFGGYSHDVTGNYYTAFAAAVLAILLSGGAIWLASPRKVRTVAGKIKA